MRILGGGAGVCGSVFWAGIRGLQSNLLVDVRWVVVVDSHDDARRRRGTPAGRLGVVDFRIISGVGRGDPCSGFAIEGGSAVVAS